MSATAAITNPAKLDEIDETMVWLLSRLLALSNSVFLSDGEKSKAVASAYSLAQSLQIIERRG